MATKQEIINRLSQCGGLSYADWIRLLDSIYFDGDLNDVFIQVNGNVLPTPNEGLTFGLTPFLPEGNYNFGSNTYTIPTKHYGYFTWNGTTKTYTLKDMGVIPSGSNGINGKTIEIFNENKPIGYVSGDQIFFNNEAIYEVKSGQTATTGQSPSTNPEKFNLVFSGGVSKKDLQKLINNSSSETNTVAFNQGKYYNKTGAYNNISATIASAITKTPIKAGDTINYKLGCENNPTSGMATLVLFFTNGNFFRVIIEASANYGQIVEGQYVAEIDGFIGATNGNEILTSPQFSIKTLGSKYYLEEKDKATLINPSDVQSLNNGLTLIKNTGKSYIYKSKGVLFDDGRITESSSNRTVYAINIKLNGASETRVRYQGRNNKGNDNIPFILKRVGNVFSILANGVSGANNVSGELTITEDCTIYMNSDSDIPSMLTSLSGTPIELTEPRKRKHRVFEDGKVISFWENELCSHSSMLYVEKTQGVNIGGFRYLAYNPNRLSPKEDAGNSECSLTYHNSIDPSIRTKIDVLKNGDTVGAFKQRPVGHSPYEPSIFFNSDGNTFKYFFSANNENDSLGKRQVYRVFNKATKTFDNEIKPCFLKYNSLTVPFSLAELTIMYNTLFGTSITFTDSVIPQTITRYVLYNGWYYCWFPLGMAPSAGGIKAFVLRTQDGETFEYVTKNTTLAHSDYPEGGIEIVNDKLYVVTRGAGCKLTYFDLLTNQWSTNIVTIPDTTTASVGRPWMMLYKGKLITICNTSTPNYKYNIGGTEYTSFRSGATIHEIDLLTLNPIEIVQLTNKFGLHYYSIDNDGRGNYYFAYSEDRRMLTNTHPHSNNRSNIGMVRFEDVIGF